MMIDKEFSLLEFKIMTTYEFMHIINYNFSFNTYWMGFKSKYKE